MRRRVIRRGLAEQQGAFLIGGAPLFVALAASSTLWLPVAVAFIGGLSTGSINPILGAVTYERIPPPLLARVMGVVKASAWVGLPIGPLLAGILVDNAGLQTALLVAAAGMLAATLPPFFLRVFAEMNRPVVPPDDPAAT